MPPELSLTTVQIIAGAKLILAATALLFLALRLRSARPWAHAALFTASIAAFYVVLMAPLRTLIGGNLGDEQFITAFFARVLDGQYFSDFYYAGLPPFYPPLYFWIVGALSAPFADGGIGAAKIGAGLTFLAWFAAPYAFNRWMRSQGRRAGQTKEDAIAADPWFWVLLPLIFFLTVDFFALLLKPYEALSALVAVCWIGGLAQALTWPRWSARFTVAFGLIGGLLFLTYYFWWFVLIPAMLALVLLERPIGRGLRRCLAVGLVMAVVSAPYTVPYVASLLRHGSENWQAFFFVINDLFTYMPWAKFSAAGLLMLAGAVGLWRFRNARFPLAAGVTLLACYLYQLANAVVLLAGGKSAVAAKPFLFLGGAALSAGAAYAAVAAGAWIVGRYGTRARDAAVLALALLLAPLFPFGAFIEEPRIHGHIERALVERGEPYLAQNIRAAVPEYRERVWLSSGTASLNAYLPLDYYVAQNPHFSHPASGYSARLATVRELAAAPDAEAFDRIIARTDISALLFFKSTDAPDAYPLLFWQDRHPNGGSDVRIDLRRGLISEARWTKVKEDDEWVIYVAK